MSPMQKPPAIGFSVASCMWSMRIYQWIVPQVIDSWIAEEESTWRGACVNLGRCRSRLVASINKGWNNEMKVTRNFPARRTHLSQVLNVWPTCIKRDLHNGGCHMEAKQRSLLRITNSRTFNFTISLKESRIYSPSLTVVWRRKIYQPK